MSELRRNPLTGEWVIIAGERGNRPNEYALSEVRSEVPSYVEGCPFCPGNETQTPPAVLEIREASPDGGWYIRGFANKYSALSPESPRTVETMGLFRAAPGNGHHEVLVETPEHNHFPASRTDGEMLRLVQAYQQRYLALLERRSIQHVLIFKNHGEEAGTSIEHPHSQIIALPVVPDSVLRRGDIAGEHYQKTDSCLLCQIVEEEIESGLRLVYQDHHFAVFHPFAASRPAETWVVPLAHQPSFGQADKQVLSEFASALLRALKQLSSGFGDPDFNYIIHSCPRGVEQDSPEAWHWYLQLVPRMTRAAGFELGSGIYINTAPPEHTAEIMRRAPI